MSTDRRAHWTNIPIDLSSFFKSVLSLGPSSSSSAVDVCTRPQGLVHVSAHAGMMIPSRFDKKSTGQCCRFQLRLNKPARKEVRIGSNITLIVHRLLTSLAVQQIKYSPMKNSDLFKRFRLSITSTNPKAKHRWVLLIRSVAYSSSSNKVIFDWKLGWFVTSDLWMRRVLFFVSLRKSLRAVEMEHGWTEKLSLDDSLLG